MASLNFIKSSKLIELLASADQQQAMFVRVLDADRILLGHDPLRPTKVIDLSTETTSPFNDGHDQLPSPAIRISTVRTPRHMGEYFFELKGKRTDCSSLKGLLAEGLKALEKNKAGTLDRLARIKARTRRIVSRDPRLLFDKARLVEGYSEPLIGGWFYGTNNSARETNVWLQRACECAGLKWGLDFKTNLRPTLDDLAELLA